MALTQAQWYAKIVSWVPTWFFESEKYNVAYFQGLAKQFADADKSADDHVLEASILGSDGSFLDLSGDERNYRRLPRETDMVYALRVQQLLNQSNNPALKALVDKVLIVGASTIREHDTDAIFCTRRSFFNRREVFTQAYYNFFTIIIDQQLHPPYSFESRGNFFSRGDFIGSNQSNQVVFDLIAEILNTNKAAGVLYRVLERE